MLGEKGSKGQQGLTGPPGIDGLMAGQEGHKGGLCVDKVHLQCDSGHLHSVLTNAPISMVGY